MALMNHTKPAPFGAITTLRIVNALAAAKNSLIAWNSRRKAYKQLSALTDRELDDIGFSRADVETMNAGLFRV